MKSKADNPKIRDRQSGNRYFIDNTFLKTWGAKLGPHCIAVYNVLVMHANADSQTAFPSFQTIGDMTGMSRRQAMREIRKLEEKNIIRVDENSIPAADPDKKIYSSNVFTLLHPDEWVKIDQSLCEPSDTQSPGVVSDSHQPSDTQSPPLVTGSHPNNTNPNKTQKTTKEKTPPKGGGKPPAANEPESRAMFSALAETCGLDIKLLTGENRGALNQAEKIMRDNGYKPADLSAFSDWWHAHDWRGKQGDDPSLPQIRETWGRFRKWQQGNIPANADPILPPLPPLSTDEAVWAEAMTIIQGSVTHATFDQLIRPLKPAGDSNGTFILLSPAELDPRLLKKIEPALIQVDHNIKKVEVRQNDPQTSHQIGPPNHHP